MTGMHFADPPIPRFPTNTHLGEPELLFHATRLTDKSPHPLRGLLRFGPYSRSTVVSSVMDPIRIAAIVPEGELHVIERLLSECASGHRPRERKAYLPDFLGIERVFGVRAIMAEAPARIEIPNDVEAQMASGRPHVVLAEHLARALARLAAVRHTFDVALIYLPERWSPGFFGLDGDDFDLHAFIKATAAPQTIPTQLLREANWLHYHCRCSVAWRLSIALYCKAGGTPWRLADMDAETAFVGLGYSLRFEHGRARFATCCSQVFDADGVSFEFLLYGTTEFTSEGDSPFLSRDEMRRVMARSLDLYQRRHCGRSPRRMVVHKNTEFKSEEIDGCFDAFRVCETVDLIQVLRDVSWRGVQIEQNRIASAYPVLRGTYLPISGRDVLLWTQGDVPSAASGRGHYFKEGKGIPSPLLLRRFAGHGGWDDTCRHLLALTKMNWNSDSLYDQSPVTLSYARSLAKIVGRLDSFSSVPYQSRFFM